MECYSAMKGNEPWIHATTCMSLNIIMLNERGQTQRFHLCKSLGNLNCSIVTVVAWAWDGEQGRSRSRGGVGLERDMRKL